MAYTYKPDDMFYDVESLENVFTVAWWVPAQNAVILSYIDDDKLIQSERDLDYIREYIYQLHPRLKAANTHIVFEDIGQTGCINEFATADSPSRLGMQSFAKRLGLANELTYWNCAVDRRHIEAGGLQYDPAFYPVKQTDPDYDENRHGYRFGYNSTNYDMTILAELVGRLHDHHFMAGHTHRPVLFDGQPVTAKSLRDFNDQLFEDEWRKNMAMRLANPPGMPTQNGFGNFKTPGWIMRKSWLLTGRYIDVARLNEKLQKVGLKRLLGMLGLQIMESEKLDGDTRLKNLEELADLLAYNISDVVNLQLLFEHKNYQNSFNVRGNLLETFPATIYDQKRGYPEPGKQQPVDTGNYMNIRKNRLTRESTSAKFVEYAIAPYAPIRDIPVVSFLYPSEMEAKKLKIQQTDILEDTKRFFEEHVTNDPNDEAHQDFMQVYNFYASIRGKNFNLSPAYVEHHGFDGQLPEDLIPYTGEYISKELMSTYNTNLFYFYKDPDGTVRRSSCLANFSIGGIHGAEVNMKAYLEDLTRCWQEKAVQDYVESLFPDATAALNGDTYITLPADLELPERLQAKLKDPDARTIKIREFVKSGSTKKKATWRDVPEVALFKKDKTTGKWGVHPNYAYVSVGESHHEDFTSYYPLLLSRLSVFINPDYHGYDDAGNPADPYYELFLTRLKKKKESKDMSLSALERELAHIEQESRKLLINAASGAGDATFDNNIRVNNAVISMRIIGQLFAWRIGQAQTLAGARVPSTNTDGLYTMDIAADLNDQILDDIAKDMHIGIEPERLDRFVSKDSNNRLEVYQGEVVSASGGTLSSWKGPQPTQSLDHAAIIDYALVKYLADERFENPADTPFDATFARSILEDFIASHRDKPQDALKHFQWVLAGSSGTHRFPYVRLVNKQTGEVSIKNLQNYNRIFLIKDTDPLIRREMYLATKGAINESTWKKRQAAYQQGELAASALWQHDEEALTILNENDFDLVAHNRTAGSPYERHEARTQKIKTMPDEQAIGIYNNSIIDLDDATAHQMLDMLDLDAYLTITAHTFRSWSNLPKNAHAPVALSIAT